ncbi:MAG: GTPase ObgE [Gammaproteobacteria bacterium RIFCSPHIGHO2_12_FULL_37_14]|nr:MAG: GTPase ObgE [Gammaproteobacteria bacterium RIFCSPHIGHO2_12_FULL_37_14]
MKFIDEAKIHVQAGKGGNGACSFLRLKFMPFGGPDGGDGGDGGSIFLCADYGINTLVDYRFIHTYTAQSGEKGGGRNCSGKGGEDLILRVPVGTMVYDDQTDELIGDLMGSGQMLCVAQGGKHGVGNARFKSSINRSPRRTIPGQEGEIRDLRLELRVLADVGLVGMPNAGKSTLISAMSAARPKIADYPFTTLYPQLGVVRVSQFHSFVMADLPGLIEGAAEGAGLGIRFLKHVGRTRLLFHVVDMFPVDGSDPVTQIEAISRELGLYSEELLSKERWLVLNKADLLPPEDIEKVKDDMVMRLHWQGPVFIVSGLAKKGLDDLAKEAMRYLSEDL